MIDSRSVCYCLLSIKIFILFLLEAYLLVRMIPHGLEFSGVQSGASFLL